MVGGGSVKGGLEKPAKEVLGKCCCGCVGGAWALAWALDVSMFLRDQIVPCQLFVQREEGRRWRRPGGALKV